MFYNVGLYIQPLFPASREQLYLSSFSYCASYECSVPLERAIWNGLLKLILHIFWGQLSQFLTICYLTHTEEFRWALISSSYKIIDDFTNICLLASQATFPFFMAALWWLHNIALSSFSIIIYWCIHRQVFLVSRFFSV